MEARNRIKSYKQIEKSKLRQRADNLRLHPDAQKEVLTAALAEFGIVDAMLVRPIDNGLFEILDGHLRDDILTNAKLPCLVLDVTDEEARKILLTHDAITELAELKPSALDELAKSTQFADETLTRFIDEMRDGATIAAIESAATADVEDDQQNEDDDDAEYDQQDDEPSQEFKAFSVPLTAEQRDQILDAVKQAKSETGAETSGEAIFHICRDWLNDR